MNPAGIFEPKSDAEEDAETPNTALAFTGTFDGNGHTPSNIKIDASDKNGAGLFGCMTGGRLMGEKPESGKYKRKGRELHRRSN